MPSSYSHDPATGSRVSQFAPIEAPTAPQAPNFRTSGYTHTRSSLNYGQSADNYHRVEEWGDPVRPYGEWRFPQRPFSTPYQNWGPPFAGLNLGFGGFYGPHGGSGRGGFGGGHPGKPGGGGRPDVGRGFGNDRHRSIRPPQASPFNPYPAGPGTPYPVAPYYDGYYPVYRD
ncbi:MAG: hypothetical protein ACR2NZ_11640 [Rubripirellula sp.]